MTQITQFTPTLMQKLLGRQYKWFHFISFHFKRVAIFRFTMVMRMVAELMNISVIIFVWKVNNINSNKENLSEILTYLAVGYLFALVSRSYLYNWLPDLISTGRITNLLMYPQSIFSLIFGRAFGQLLVANLVGLLSIPFIVLITWGSLLPSNSTFSFLIFLLCISVSTTMGILWNIILSCGTFFTAEPEGLIIPGGILARIASGFYLPFSFLGSYSFLQWNPFAFTFYHPMQIYLGKYDINQTLLVFAGGIAWCIILYFLAKIIFRLGLKRNEAVGL
jgi:ABC-2 type transport system permease protein